MDKQWDSFFSKHKTESVNKKHHSEGSKEKRQEAFSNNRKGVVEKTENAKKPFDKKAYRLKKYSKKYKLEQWEEQRKKRLLREYKKETKNNPAAGTYKPKSFDEDIPDGSEHAGKYVRHPDFIDKENSEVKFKDPFYKAKEQFNKVKQEKLEKQQEMERVKEEKRQKLEQYKKKKHDRFKKLSQKTKKGQPIMTGRMELLLEKIQGSK